MPPLLALDAEVEIVSLKGERHVPLASFVQGPRQVALQPEEMVSAIIVPERAALGSSRFLKLGARKHLVISIAMVAVRLEVESDVIREAALVVGACGPVATRLPAVEAVLRGTRVADAIDLIPSDVVASVLSPISDVRGDADYRVDVAVTLLRRAVDDVVRQFS